MQAVDLKFPGDSALSIRREVARQITDLEDAVGQGAPVVPDFAAFLLDAATQTPGYVAPTLPTTQAVVTNGVKQSGWTVTGTGTFFTPTVVGGVCTGGVLSTS